MLKVVEAFSGIGSQAKALENLYINHEILYTADWDINAIIAYDLIHNGVQDLKAYENLSKEELIEKLNKYTLSMDGKKPLPKERLNNYHKEFLCRLYAAIQRSKNFVSITDIKGEDLPNDLDMLTYSFPCQDLSSAGFWHGNKGGIDRNAKNRSGMLWEVERILLERFEKKLTLPKMLLMENVSNIIKARNIENFNDWQASLEKMGYYNEVFTLNALNYGVPQKRVRTYMLSVLCTNNTQRHEVEKFFLYNNLEKHSKMMDVKDLNKYIKIDYKVKKYKSEANLAQPNNTPSRRQIYDENIKILDEKGKVKKMVLPTVTTKQDRNPNSGVIDYKIGDEKKCQFRYLTPRECFLLMGFDEKDYEVLIDNQIKTKGKNILFTTEKLYKLAGNSIVVDVLEEIFKQVDYIKNNILIEEHKSNKIMDFKKKLELLNRLNLIDEED